MRSQYSQMEDTIAMLTEKNQAKNKELNALQEALKILRNKRDDSQEVRSWTLDIDSH